MLVKDLYCILALDLLKKTVKFHIIKQMLKRVGIVSDGDYPLYFSNAIDGIFVFFEEKEK